MANDAEPFVFDLLCDGDRAVPHAPMGGWWGRIKSSSLWPFVLHVNGNMDFGSDPEDDQSERYWKTNLFEIEINVGSKVILTDSSGEVLDLVIKSVDILSEIGN